VGFLRIETPPTSEPVTLPQAKLHLRVDPDVTTDDDLIELYIQAAREFVEYSTGRSFVSKGYVQVHDAFPYYVPSALSQSAVPPQYFSGQQWPTTAWNESQKIKLYVSPVETVDRIAYQASSDQQWHNLRPTPFPRAARRIYVIGNQVTDGTNLQEVSATADVEEGALSVSGANTPTWATGLGDTTTDGDLTWTNKGAAPAGDFQVDAYGEPPRLFPLPGQPWPTVLYKANVVAIHFRAGYGDGKSAPATGRLAMMHLVNNWYQNREPVNAGLLTKIPLHFDDVLETIRVVDYSPTA
jgi:hypothetical protein